MCEYPLGICLYVCDCACVCLCESLLPRLIHLLLATSLAKKAPLAHFLDLFAEARAGAMIHFFYRARSLRVLVLKIYDFIAAGEFLCKLWIIFYLQRFESSAPAFIYLLR